MVITMRKNNIAWLLAALLCLMALAPAALAAETGSIKVIVEDSPDLEIVLHPVADLSGTLTEAFSGADIAPETMLDTREAEVNAAALYRYALAHQLEGEVKTTDASGVAHYTGLAEGCYLIYCTKEGEFDPFLVFVPTEINEEKVYDVEAEPKSEEEEETEPTTVPTEPSESTQPTQPEPEIPQTGTSVVPKYVLLSLGVLAALVGMAELIRGRKEKHE